MSFDIQRIQK